MGEARPVRDPGLVYLILSKFGFRPYERATLNEAPIYLHTYYITLAVVQSVVHLYYDYDRISIPSAEPNSKGKDQRTHPLRPIKDRLKSSWGEVFAGCKRAVILTAVYPVIYAIFFRRPAWSFTMYFAKLFWNFARSAAKPPGFFPGMGFNALGRSAILGSLLICCWETSNILFSIFLGQEPLKRGQPLTSEAKDPNGSLLNGLNSKKEVVKSFAFWELSFISQRFPDRRKAIFNDIDREGGAVWSQILNSSVELIKGIQTRINESKQQSSQPSQQETQKPAPEIHALPRLAEPPKSDAIFASSPKAISRRDKFTESVSSTAKSYGQSADWTPAARAKARDAFGRVSSSVLSPERKQKLLAPSRELRLLTGATKIEPETIHPLTARILRSPIGQPFRQTYARRLSNIVLGRPFSELCLLVDAIEVVTRLLIASITEDTLGKVNTDVPAVVSLFTNTIITLESFVHGGLKVHWTDVTYPPSSQPQEQVSARRIPEVDIVLATLKFALADLVRAFGENARDYKLGDKEVRLAREAAGMEKDLLS